MARRSQRSVSEAIVKYSGRHVLLGTIDYTATSKTNHQATTSFNNTGNALLGKVLIVQPSTNVYLGWASTNTGTVSSSNGLLIFANERVILTADDIDSSVPAGEFFGWLAAIRDSVDGNLRVFELV